MAVLSNANRMRIWRGLMRWWSARRDPIGSSANPISKPDLRAAVDATDVFINSNAAAYNAALPAEAQAGLTAAQKVLLFCAVALMRVDVEALKQLFGEVD